MKNTIKTLVEKKRFKVILMGLALILIAVGATYAWWTASVSTKQEIEMGKLKISANFEELTDPLNYEPGLTAEIDGIIKNEGSIATIAKVSNTSQIQFVYANDEFLVIPEEERNFGTDQEGAITLSFGPTSGKFEDNQEVYWFTDKNNQIYVLMEPSASLNLTIVSEFNGDVMSNKYQESQIKVGGLLNATQVLDGALIHEFGIDSSELRELNDTTTKNARSKQSLSRGETRLQELVSRH